AAERLLAVKATPDAHRVLAEALNAKYTFEKDGPEKQQDMVKCEKEARLAISTTRSPSAAAYSVLANVLEDKHSYPEASANFGSTVAAAKATHNGELETAGLQGLIRCSDAQLKFDDADRFLES